MMAASLVLLSGQMALQQSVDVVANNIANSSTTGFKREGIEFQSLLSGLKTNPSAANTRTHFVYDSNTYRDTSPGVITNTGNSLDLAIQGPGYFQIKTPTGTQYTRDGAFRTDNQGQIVTSTGMPVLSDAGQPIALPEDAIDVTIGPDGFITAQVGTGSTRAQLGKIGVVTFDDEQKVVPAGHNLFTTTQTPTPITTNPIIQGAIEESNVKPVAEITDLIKLQRAYEQTTNLVSQEDQRLDNAIDKLSQTS